MEMPQKRQKSWLSSLTGLVSGSRGSAMHSASESMPSQKTDATTAHGDVFASRLRPVRADAVTPSRYSGTFSAPPVESPESSPKRASPTLLAQRKIHERAQGPSGHAFSSRISNSRSFPSGLSHSSTTPKRTNFSSAATPKNMFRESVARDMPAFSFTPRVAPTAVKGSFSATTPGRPYRAPGIEMNDREPVKTTSHDPFPMKIPDPDPKLSGEAVANMVPKHFQTGGRSVYANEYLAHLCPPDFNEEQRNQFFCILDLRRLKYAADEVFNKKDWRLNILNFAKEYEKNRSLIMLRYGLYEFKTVKVSKDVFQKWKADNNIPDLDEDQDMEGNSEGCAARAKITTPAPKASKLNGTEGILRSEKRKAQDSIDSSAPAAFSTANKRSRALDNSKAERAMEKEPLAGTRTPTLNKSKRRPAGVNNAEQSQRAKAQKAAPTSLSGTPSATRTLFEKVTNSPVSTPEVAAENLFIQVSKPAVEETFVPKPALKPVSAQSSVPSSEDLARSVFENRLKPNSAQNNANIFGYLSDASSAKGSGKNGNADDDAEDTEESDGQEEPEPAKTSIGKKASAKETQPKATPSLFAPKPADLSTGTSSASAGSSASTAAPEPAPARSLFDRVSKTSDGQPIRMFGTDAGNTSSATPLFGSKPVSGETNAEKGPALFGANKTWNPDTPIKFAESSTAGDSTAKAPSTASNLFGAAASKAPIPTSLFGSAINGAAQKETPFISKETSTSASTSGGLQPAAPLFGFSNKTAGTTAPAAAAASETPSLFGACTAGSSAPAISLFGKPQEQPPATTTAPTLFGAAVSAKPATSSALQSQTLFGSALQPSTPSYGQKRSGDNDSSAPASTTPFLFGSALKNDVSGSTEPQAKKPLFGSSSAFSQPSSTGDAKANGTAEQSKPAPEVPKLFSMGSANGGAAEPPKSQASTLFGNSSAAPAVGSTSGTIFSFGSANNSTATQPVVSSFTFGAPATQPQASTVVQTSTPSFGGADTASAPSSFTFNAGGASDGQSFRNPFSFGDSNAGAQPAASVSFGSNQSTSFSAPFHFGAGTSSTPATAGSALFSFGAGSQPASQPSGTTAPFSFGAGTTAQPSGTPMFGQQPISGNSMFNLAPPVGASTGTNTPFTNLGGASSLASTPATGTPEPGATQDKSDHTGHQADGDEAPQEQISLTEGGPGEEDESVVYEVRAKALKLVTAKDEAGDGMTAGAAKKSPWKTEGVGPLRLLKHKTTGAVRLLLRGEPRGNVALNRVLLPDFEYKPEPNAKYVKLTTANESGTGLETWMLQVKTKDAAQALASAFEENKLANKK